MGVNIFELGLNYQTFLLACASLIKKPHFMAFLIAEKYLKRIPKILIFECFVGKSRQIAVLFCFIFNRKWAIRIAFVHVKKPPAIANHKLKLYYCNFSLFIILSTNFFKCRIKIFQYLHDFEFLYIHYIHTLSIINCNFNLLFKINY